MSFTYTEIYREKTINGTVIHGKYVNSGGSTGGSCVPSLSLIHGVAIQPLGSSVVANQPVVNASATDFPIEGATGVTIVTTANESGLITISGI